MSSLSLLAGRTVAHTCTSVSPLENKVILPYVANIVHVYFFLCLPLFKVTVFSVAIMRGSRKFCQRGPNFDNVSF